MLAERVFHDRALVFVHRCAQIGDRIVIGPARFAGGCRRAAWLGAQGRRGGLPWAVERVEDDMADRISPIVPAIDRAFDHVAQLADIARPGVLFHLFADVVGKARPPFPADLRRHATPEIFGENRYIALAHPQGRQSYNLETQAIEEVGAKIAALGLGREVLIRGGDDAHVHADRTARADTRDLAIFDRAQQALLRTHRQRAQFVEEQRALVRLLEPADALLRGAGEGARLVPEQFGLDQRFGESGTVHRDERFVPAGRQAMEAFGNQFLARSALANDQNRTPHRCGTAGPLDRVEKGTRLPDELIFPLHSPWISENSHILATGTAMSFIEL